MKILFLYNDPIHAWTLLRARESAANLGLEIEAYEERSAQAFDRYFTTEFDVLLIHQELMSEQVVDCGRPVVILERIDGAQLGSSRRWIRNVEGVLKGYCLRPVDLNNRYRGRVLAHRLRDAGITGRATCLVDGLPDQIPAANLAKIRPFYGFGAYSSRQAALARSPDLVAPRVASVLFAGTIAYSESEVETHRRLAVRAARSVRGGIGHGGRVLPFDEYCGHLLKSHCVLSPFGWGEACHRDYEAWALGTVVIKPECDYVEGWPDCYRAGETYVACRPDFADVPELAARIKRDWDALRPMRERCRLLAEQAADPAAIAARLKTVLEELL